MNPRSNFKLEVSTRAEHFIPADPHPRRVWSAEFAASGNCSFLVNQRLEIQKMHHSRLGGLIIDCKTDDLNREAAFWSKALGYEIRPSDDPGDENYVILATPDGEPYIEVQSVEHPSRVHLDIKTDDLEAEVQRLERLGAVRVKMVKHWWVMEAPSGHRFCVIPLHTGQNVGTLHTWNEST